MPEAAVQCYWHQLPTPVSPWNTTADLQKSITISQTVPTRVTPHNALYYLPTRAKKERSSSVSAVQKEQKHSLLYPGLGPTTAINTLLNTLGAPLVTVDEGWSIVKEIQSSQTAADLTPPMVRATQLIVEARSNTLSLQVLTRKELHLHQHAFSPNDLPVGKMALIAADNTSTAVVCCFTEWGELTAEQRRILLLAKSGRMYMFAPDAEPQPFAKHIHSLRPLYPRNCTVMLLSKLSDEETARTDRKKKKRRSEVAPAEDSILLSQRTQVSRGVAMNKFSFPIGKFEGIDEDDPLRHVPSLPCPTRNRSAKKQHYNWVQNLLPITTRKTLYAAE